MSRSRFVFRVCLFALFALVGCSDEVTRTQLTFSITASPSVRASVDNLRVTVRSSGKGDQTANFRKAELDWPVEIVVLPEAGNKSTDSITLLVSAFAADDTLLANQTTSAAFQPERVREVPVTLGADAVNAGEPDGGQEQEEIDAGTPQTKPDSSAPPPPPENCSTKPNKFKCDDGNPCNGKEGCNPASSNALPNGCVPSDSPVACGADMTCDVATGECSTCLKKSDGDGDGVKSMACGGLDCDDNDPAVAPKKTEKCNNRDDDCDGTRDGEKADADCKAPTGGTASCVSGACVGKCNNSKQQIKNGVCEDVPVGCPATMPCAPGGRCTPGSPSYVCMCDLGYRAGVGMTRCAPIGVPLRTIGFEATCDGMPTPGTFGAVSPTKAIASTLYAACGISSLTSGSLMTAVQLIQPTTPVIAGITKDTALVVTPGVSTTTLVANAELAIAFAPPVNEVSFDILDIDNLPGLTVTTSLREKAVTGGILSTPTAKHARFTYLEAKKPIDQVSITYTPLLALDELYVDQLSYRVGGCGDNVVEGDEACDDGNAIQCDGCDNACGTSSKGCLNGSACLAAGAVTSDSCSVCNLTATPAAGGDFPLSKNPSAASSCTP